MRITSIGRARPRSIAVAFAAASTFLSMLGFAPAAHAAVNNVGCSTPALISVLANPALADGDIVNLTGNCTYTLNSPYLATDNGLPAITKDITIYGYGAKIVRSKNAPSFRHLEIDGGASVRIVNLTLSGGGISNSNGSPTAGSVLIDGGSLQGEKLTVKGNKVFRIDGTVVAAGGGILNDGGNLSLKLSTVSDNDLTAVAAISVAAGGGIAAAPGSTTTLTKTVVKGNDVEVFGALAGVALGGGVGSAGTLTVDGSTISGNSVDALSGLVSVAAGGGLGIAGPTTVRESTISGNKATAESSGLSAALGAGIAQLGSTLDVDMGPDDDGSVVSSNKASCPDTACFAVGGGYAGAGALANFNLTVFKSNTASAPKGGSLGGGLAALAGSTVNLTDATVTKNTAKGRFAFGGGIYSDTSSTVSIDSSTINGNKPGNCLNVLGC